MGSSSAANVESQEQRGRGEFNPEERRKERISKRPIRRGQQRNDRRGVCSDQIRDVRRACTTRWERSFCTTNRLYLTGLHLDCCATAIASYFYYRNIRNKFSYCFLKLLHA